MKKIFILLSEFIKARWIRKWKTREELEKYQYEEISKHIEYMKNKSPYFIKNGIKDNFQMNKKFMVENFDLLNTVGIKKDEALKIAIEGEKTRNFTKKYKGISVGLSSGTSGHRGIFVTTEEEQGIWAGMILAKMLPKGAILGNRIAFFLRADNNLYKSINSFFIKLRYFDLFRDIENHIEELNRYRPTVLVAPASALSILGQKKVEGKLNIAPRQIISVAEVLEEKDAEWIKEIFSIKFVYQIYQATEGLLGYTCHCGSLHLNEEWIKFEKDYIDDRRFYPIITDFKRKSQPFIRYHLNDILMENKEKCKCGSVFTRIEKIEGRSDDIFYFIDKKGNTRKVFPDFIRRCMLFSEGIREYQVFQISYYKMEIAVLNLEEYQKKEIKEEFENLFKQLEVENVEIGFIPYLPEKNTKLRRIYQKMDRI